MMCADNLELYRWQKCTFFSTPYQYCRRLKNESVFTKMFREFIKLKIQVQLLCSC